MATINIGRDCDGCGTCVEQCPMDVFVLEQDKAMVHKIEECMSCKLCETVCPKGLIQVED